MAALTPNTVNKKKRIVYGRDDRHGRSGPDYSSPGSAYSSDNLETGSDATGYELKPFRGEYLDKLSIEEIKDDEAAEETVRMCETDQEILSELGYGTDGSTLRS